MKSQICLKELLGNIYNVYKKIIYIFGISATNRIGQKSLQPKTFATDFFLIYSLRLNIFFPPHPEIQFPNFLDIRNPWGKVNGKKWSQIVKLLLIKGVKLPRKKMFFQRIFPN